MRKEFIIYLLLLMLSSLSVSAANSTSSAESSTPQDRVSVVFYLREFQTRESVSNKFVLIGVEREGQEKKEYYDYTDSDGILDFATEKGKSDIILKVDDMGTEGKDYYVKYSGLFDEDINKTLFIFPVGTISGLVLDKLDNVVGGATLQFNCNLNYASDFPSSSDTFGSFKSDFAPVGLCRIYASYGDAMGTEEVKVIAGNVTDVEIRLDKTIISFEEDKLPPYFFFFVGFIAVVFAYITIIFITRRKSAPKAEHEQKTPVDRRMHDIISTLRKDEKTIVELLLKSGSITQSKVYHETGMPKTTLHRQIQSLEQKNIISVEKIGKMKKLALTDWFVGKERK